MTIPAQAGRSAGPSDDRRSLIMAATELFTERPYHDVTPTEIAQRAGVPLARHFAGKRGVYLAAVATLAEGLNAGYERPPTCDTPAARVRELLDRHVRYLEDNASVFRALMSGGIGSDPDVRGLIEASRWRGVRLVLRVVGVTEPIGPALHTAVRGWAGYLDESIMDHLRHRDLTRNDLVELAVATLAAALRTANAIEPGAGPDLALIDQLND